jgi:hypothetical protein
MGQNLYSGRYFETSPCTGFCLCSLLSNGLSADNVVFAEDSQANGERCAS